jgi:DNA-binding transcriptional regulator YiaG
MDHAQVLANISLQIKTHRRAQGLSQAALAALSGVSTSFVRDAETRVGKCTIEKLLKVWTALGLEVASHEVVA